MSMLNKKGNVFTLLGIQEDKCLFSQGHLEPETIRREDINLFLGIKGVSTRYFHDDYDSNVQKEQNGD